jgi:uncharacterized protein YbaR (Trm112 family)
VKTDLMEILACPICKNPNLELITINENQVEIETGIINCTQCHRFYPIRNTIPIMLPDEMRKEAEELEFLELHEKNIPEKILKNGKPFHLHD